MGQLHYKQAAMPQGCLTQLSFSRFKASTHWRQSWIQHGRLCCRYWQQSIFNKVNCCRIRSTLLLVCTGPKPHSQLSTKSTVAIYGWLSTKLTVFCWIQICRQCVAGLNMTVNRSINCYQSLLYSTITYWISKFAHTLVYLYPCLNNHIILIPSGKWHCRTIMLSVLTFYNSL